MTLIKLLLVPSVAAAALLAGCASRPVRCDEKLMPINAPAHVQKEKAS